MSRSTLYFLLILVSTQLSAVPRFAAREGVDCASCHIFPGGGAARNEYGREFSTDYLSRKSGSILNGINDRLPGSIGIGADIRGQLFAQPGPGEMDIFPMQSAFYTTLEKDTYQAFIQAEYRNGGLEISYALRYDGLPIDTWFSAGRQIPGAGQKLDDHTALIRGGNLTLQGLDTEGMPFDPYVERPRTLSIGYSPFYFLTLQAGGGTSFLSADEDANHRFFRVDAKGEMGPIGLQINLSSLSEAALNFHDLGALLSMGPLVYHAAITMGEHYPLPDMTSFAAYHEFSWLLFQGLDLVARYEFFDPDMELSTGALNRISLGAEFFPMPGMEIKFIYRSHSLENVPYFDKTRRQQLLLQLHLYH